MGAGESKSSAATVGLHVLRVAEASPSADAGIEPFFDHIVGFNGQPMTDDVDAFTSAVELAEEQRQYLTLQIWSSKREELRDVRLLPSRSWALAASTSSQQDAQPSLLGLSLRLCSPEGALDQVWHILDILEGSPAQAAGLVGYGDYVIGYSGGVLRGEGDFYNLIEEHEGRSLRLFVYNADFDVTREVVIVPNRDWGTGGSLLGCGVGYGLLHRIPKPQDRPPAPPELIEADQANAYTATAGVSLIDTSGAEPPKPSGAEHHPNRNTSASPLSSSSNRGSPVRPPPLSPSGQANKRNSIVGLVEEED